ncbi:ATP-binding cassette domain-containing protein [Actinoplanes sp. TBRC 11911]|uniref:ABC transporter ATP-binding protein n=1 Tax=Actinoplanes sp. TBRC 11911 TaxID=2729386 RepID=UPI00145E2CFD|nr:ATP-binding cassette domain-containing protein [Actinoplanes sp. TBRC 11911]NMO51190.1 ATP-binding cassette domain-containing protein [Actinoplanes sp. TBRC 11911]
MLRLRGKPGPGDDGSLSPASGSEAVIRFVHVSHRPLHDITLAVHPGEAVAITGPADSGKTALLRLASAQDRPDAGSVVIDGVRTESVPGHRATRLRRRIGVVSAGSVLMSALTVVDNVVFPLLHQRVSFDPYERALRLLDAVGMADAVRVRASRLSGSQRMRVVLARALANQPRLVVADEPVAGLDRRAATEILDLLKRLTTANGTALLLATADEATAARAPRVVRLRAGVVVADVRADVGPAARAAARQWIERPAPVI